MHADDKIGQNGASAKPEKVPARTAPPPDTLVDALDNERAPQAGDAASAGEARAPDAMRRANRKVV